MEKYTVTKQTALYFLMHILFKFDLTVDLYSYYDVSASDYILRLEQKEDNI